MSEVKSFKLVTGEEIVSEVTRTLHLLNERLDPHVSSDVSYYELRRPHVLQLQQVAPGQFGLALVPWVLSNPDIGSIQLPISSVIVSFSPNESVERQYLEQTSGISLAL